MYLFNLGCREVAVSDTLTVMSFNLLRAFNEQCGSLWKDRVSGVQHIVRTYSPDILGTQEGCALHYVTYFHLPNVTRYPIAVYHGRVDRCTSSSALRFNVEIMNSMISVVMTLVVTIIRYRSYFDFNSLDGFANGDSFSHQRKSTRRSRHLARDERNGRFQKRSNSRSVER